VGLTTAFKTGLRCLVVLARSGTGPLSAKALAEELGTSEKYLEQVLLPLRRAKLIRSQRGTRGGYVLARSPAAVSIAEVMRVLQGPLTLCDCEDGQCHECVRPELWRSLEVCWDATLGAVTLAHIASDQELIFSPSRPTLRVGMLCQDGAGI
jgi:Rrf2 family cysteine metabolism transcriptional repressor